MRECTDPLVTSSVVSSSGLIADSDFFNYHYSIGHLRLLLKSNSTFDVEDMEL